MLSSRVETQIKDLEAKSASKRAEVPPFPTTRVYGAHSSTPARGDAVRLGVSKRAAANSRMMGPTLSPMIEICLSYECFGHGTNLVLVDGHRRPPTHQSSSIIVAEYK